MSWMCSAVLFVALGLVLVRFAQGVQRGLAEHDAARPPAASARRAAAFVEDLSFGDAQAKRLRGELAGGDWQGAHRALEATAGDWAAREFLVEALAEPGTYARRERTLEAWARGRPESALPRLVRGRWRVAAAWDARGSGGAKTVSEEGWRRFFALLKEAEQDLQAAAALDPKDPTPWAFLTIAARGLQLEKDEVRRRADEARARDPHHWGANVMLMVGLCQKWSGSHAAMFEHARRCAAEAPEGSLLPGIVALAHVERWLWAKSFAEKPQDDPEWFGKAEQYLADPAVKAELAAAWDRSLGSSRFRDTPLAPRALNAFAWCFARAGDPARARAALERLGGRLTQTPWGFLGDPRGQLDAARRAAGLPPLA